ncbi:hypothetical protein CHS0354_007388 [Potamilus streckersoni]|uniref:Uncharacterized protein n=1 Tax=Potamilus streckersoni TaxID=2493646 RepID=A0AAE0TE95_9BIVA|nr:hypothetical protein CHS0354_007388 [Potamilus streckersoni]
MHVIVNILRHSLQNIPSPTKKATAMSQRSAKRARSSRYEIQESLKRPTKMKPLSTPNAANFQTGTSKVSDRLTTKVTQEIHNKFDQLVAILSPSTENSPQAGFQLGPTVAIDNTPAESMVFSASVETTALLTCIAADTGNVVQIVSASGDFPNPSLQIPSVTQLTLIPDKERPSHNRTVDAHWSKFTTVLCEKYPLITTSLPYHMETVLTLADRSGDWRYYDEHFSQLVAKVEAICDTTYLELFIYAELES